MKKTIVLKAMIALLLCFLLTACSSGADKLAVSDPEYADYVGAWFRGEDPWGGKLTVTIKSIVGGKMEWTFADSFDNSTLYQEMKGTEVKDGLVPFDVQGRDAEDRNTVFRYQGTMQLKDGAVVMTFEKGAVENRKFGDGSPVRDAEALADAGISGRVLLEKPAESELTTYTVQPGDSLHSIAKHFSVSTKDLAIMNQTVIIETARANGYEFDDVIEYARYLFPGEVLVVPVSE